MNTRGNTKKENKQKPRHGEARRGCAVERGLQRKPGREKEKQDRTKSTESRKTPKDSSSTWQAKPKGGKAALLHQPSTCLLSTRR